MSLRCPLYLQGDRSDSLLQGVAVPGNETTSGDEPLISAYEPRFNSNHFGCGSLVVEGHVKRCGILGGCSLAKRFMDPIDQLAVVELEDIHSLCLKYTMEHASSESP